MEQSLTDTKQRPRYEYLIGFVAFLILGGIMLTLGYWFFFDFVTNYESHYYENIIFLNNFFQQKSL